ncbi:MAG: UDP-N-acetylmuramoyl-L-alanyl-D-glutamate--2,6-diaminopimelate ligase [Pseudobdellovibrionaceae bacterium]
MKLEYFIQSLFAYLKLNPKVDLNFCKDIELRSLKQDSRQIQDHDVFVAILGHGQDGHKYIHAALNRGAKVVIAQNFTSEQLSKTQIHYNDHLLKIFLGNGNIFLQVNDSAEALSFASALWNNFPSRDLFVVGVTGTNGKTSVTYMIESVLQSLSCPAAVIGTVNHHFADKIWPAEMTTPDAVFLQKRVQEIKDQGAQALAIEISSHALQQKRAHHLDLNVAIFTNLTRDHLDFHGSMDDYFLAKEKIFSEVLASSIKNPRFAILNIDDPWVQKVQIRSQATKLTFSQKNNADFQFKILEMNFGGTSFQLKVRQKDYVLKTDLIGDYNIQNLVAAIASGFCYYMQFNKLNWAQLIENDQDSIIENCQSALQSFAGVPGRLQKVKVHEANKKPTVLIDYAHTPDALENVLKTLDHIRQKKSLSQKIFCVFGCGGDRDKGKRPLMAQISSKYADHVIVTSDNPRTENPDQIILDIVSGFPQDFKNFFILPSRQQAIEKVVAEAAPEDVVLIAGKGHENYQIIGQQKLDFDDFKIAHDCLNLSQS